MLRSAEIHPYQALVLCILAGGCSTLSQPTPKPLPLPVAQCISVTTEYAEVASGLIHFDLYLPPGGSSRPLVVVAHGFWRDRTYMAGWGRRLAEEGFAAAVPDLPAWADHRRNGRAINELIAWLCAGSRHSSRIDDKRIGVMGFSAGGLSSLLAAAENPAVRVWVGLDPVDRDEWGATAARSLRAKAVVLGSV